MQTLVFFCANTDLLSSFFQTANHLPPSFLWFSERQQQKSPLLSRAPPSYSPKLNNQVPFFHFSLSVSCFHPLCALFLFSRPNSFPLFLFISSNIPTFSSFPIHLTVLFSPPTLLCFFFLPSVVTFYC